MAQCETLPAPPLSQAAHACPACHCSENQVFLTGQGDHSRDIQGTYRYLLCSRCRLRFQTVSAAEAARLYGDLEDVAPTVRSSTRRPLRCDDDIVATMKRLAPGNRLLDVGAGDGYFLEAAVQGGFNCLGTDVSERLAENARARAGAPVKVGDVCELELPRNHFHVANLDGVLIYVTDPPQMIRRIADLLAPGGVLRIREWDADSVLARMRGDQYWIYGPTRVNIWTRAAIFELAKAAGLEVHRIFPGTESSLKTWLEMERKPTLMKTLKSTALFALRKLKLGPWYFGSDTAIYLRKPVK